MAFELKSTTVDLFEYLSKLKGKKKIKTGIMAQREVFVRGCS